MYIREIEGTVGYELTDEGKKFILERVKRAEQKARKLFAKVDRMASRAGEETQARAVAWARRNGRSEEEIEAIGDRFYREAELLIWIRQALREDVVDSKVMARAYDFSEEVGVVEGAVEEAGRRAAAEIGFEEKEWWRCGYFERDDEDDKSA